MAVYAAGSLREALTEVAGLWQAQGGEPVALDLRRLRPAARAHRTRRACPGVRFGRYRQSAAAGGCRRLAAAGGVHAQPALRARRSLLWTPTPQGLLDTHAAQRHPARHFHAEGRSLGRLRLGAVPAGRRDTPRLLCRAGRQGAETDGRTGFAQAAARTRHLCVGDGARPGRRIPHLLHQCCREPARSAAT